MNRMPSPGGWRVPALVLALVAWQAGAPGIDAAKSSMVVTFSQENVPVERALQELQRPHRLRPGAAGGRQGGARGHDRQPGSGLRGLQFRGAQAGLAGQRRLSDGKFRFHLDQAGGSRGIWKRPATLTLKGKAQTLTVPVTVGKAGNATSFDGELTISRAYFGIGDKEWNDVLEDKVRDQIPHHRVSGVNRDA